MLEKLLSIYERWHTVGSLLMDSDVMKDMKNFTKLSKEYKDLQIFADTYIEYNNIVSNINHSKAILQIEKEAELRQMAKEEWEELELKRLSIEADVKILLLPKDPQDEKNAILEIRAGTGGDEAGLFAANLYRMYLKFCDIKRWKAEIVSQSEGINGGIKEIIIEVSGINVYGILKYESGVHRVQRVPDTEANGRIHTSAASVAVLPEADEVDVVLNESDIKKDTFRASGAGGQHVNKTESAIRLTHLPSGIVVECQDERSQIKNYSKALKVMRSRLYERELQKHNDAIALKRKTLVSTGDRSAKIRTYNYPQGRVTDHRIGFTMYNLPVFLDGQIQEMIEALQVEENAQRLSEATTY